MKKCIHEWVLKGIDVMNGFIHHWECKKCGEKRTEN